LACFHGMGNINGVPEEKKEKDNQVGAVIDSHLSRREYFIQMV